MRQHLHKIYGVLLVLITYTFPAYGQIYTMDGTPIDDCTGFFMDSGGGAGDYELNESFTTTLCSDGSEGTHIQLQFSSIDIGVGESFVVYDSDAVTPGTELDGTFLTMPDNPFTLQATAANTTGCLTIVFTSDETAGNNAGWSAAISCIASCQIILSDLVSSIPEAMPQDTGWIDICPGDRVEFFGTGIYPQDGIVYNHSNLTSSFEWVFGDGNTAVGPDVTNVYTEPGGYIVQLKITDQFGCENTNFISQRIRVSTYPTYNFGGTLDDTYCSGDTIMITSSIDTSSTANVSVHSNEGAFQQTLVISNPLLLPDGTGAAYETTLSFTQFSPGAILTNPSDLINASLVLEHSYGGDLDIELICPDGTSIFILDYPAGLAFVNFGEPFASSPIDGQSNDLTLGIPYTYVFVNNAANGTLPEFNDIAPTYTYTTVPSINTGLTYTYSDVYFPAGEYEPQESFDGLLGCPLNGDWTIRVQDNLGADNGWMTQWSLTFADHLYTSIETFTPNIIDWGWDSNPSVISIDQNTIEASAINAGIAAYTFWSLDDFGCRNETTLHFDILPPYHEDCFECGMEINEQEDVVLCEGDVAQLNVESTVDLEECITFERFPQDLIGAGNHPSGNPYQSSLMVNSMNPLVITNPLEDICSVCVNFSTNFLSDINISLESPDGSVLPLSLGNGGGSQLGYVNTCFTPTSFIDIGTAAPPYTGEFQPEGNWNLLIGSPINGEWNLVITDAFGILDYGELAHWSITFKNVNEYTYTWTPSSDLSCNDCDITTASPATSTAYDLLVEDIYGCSIEETINISVIEDLPNPIVSCEQVVGGIQFTWEEIVSVTEYEYNIIINGVPQGWVNPYADNMLLVGSLENNDEVSLIVRPYFANNANNCPIPEGTSTCIASFCALDVGNAIETGVSCFGEIDGRLEIIVNSGEAPFVYEISGDPTLYTNPLIENLAPGDYTYTVTDDFGCGSSFDFTITTPDSLFADATQTFIGCFGSNEGLAEVTPGGGSGSGYTFLWNNSQITSIASGFGASNNFVVVTDGSGCVATAEVTTTQLPAIEFTLETTQPSCNNFNDATGIISQISGGLGQVDNDYTYTWSDNIESISRVDLTGGVNYSVTVTDAQGCEGTISQNISNPAPITFSIQTIEPSCHLYTDASAEVLNLSGPNGATFTIQWDAATGSQQTALANDLAAGIYSVMIEDELGCTVMDQITIDQPEEIASSFDIKDNQCFGEAQGSILASVNGGAPIYTYQWTGGNSTSTLNNLLSGTYTVTITDSRNCEISETISVGEPEALESIVVPTAVSCYGDRDGMLEIEVIGGSSPFRYSLDNDFFIGASTMIGLYPGDYVITIEDANGCQITTTSTVDEPDEFSVDAGMDLSILFGDSIDLFVIVSNAQGIAEIIWGAPYEGTLSCTECPKPFASPDFTIDYEVYVIDERGCEDTDRIRVFVDKPKLVAVPTGFTPNNDGFNDLLVVHGKPGTIIMDFQVFDRWGEMVYQTKEFKVNNDIMGWDGEFRSAPMNSDVYIWYVIALHEDGTEEVYRGQTTLIR